MIRHAIRSFVAVAALLPAGAQQGPDPVILISRAEALLEKADQGGKEEATLLLWDALAELHARGDGALQDAARRAALVLLEAHDPLDGQRRRVWREVADEQVAIARRYRTRKWYEMAEDRLRVAELFDPAATEKERRLLAAKRPAAGASQPASPPGGGDGATRPLTELLRRENTQFVSQTWRETPAYLEVDGSKASVPKLAEWVCERRHENDAIVVELGPAESGKGWNAALGVGLRVLDGTNHFSGYRCYCQCWPARKAILLTIWEVHGMELKKIAESSVEAESTADGFHRLAVHVVDDRIRLQIDGQPAAEGVARAPVRGSVGTPAGKNDNDSCAVRFRNFRIEPLPSEQPSDDDLRQQAAEQRQHAVTAAIERARQLMADKQGESAARSLRAALGELDQLPDGVLRDNLEASILQMLRKADPIDPQGRKAAASCAEALGRLADGYAEDGRLRLALALVEQAAGFDRDGQAERLAAISGAVRDWNLAQAAARSSELQPPDDDGALLRQWFGNGRLLDSRRQPWVVEGPAARVEDLEGFTALMPETGVVTEGSFGVHVRLPAKGSYAGVCFDVAGPHDYAVAFLTRGDKQLTLVASRYVNGRWTKLRSERVAVDPWRLDGWFGIDLEIDARAVEVRAAGGGFAIERKLLGAASGRFGLCAGNSGPGPVTLELRALRVAVKGK